MRISIDDFTFENFKNSTVFQNYLWTPIPLAANTYFDISKKLGHYTVFTHLVMPAAFSIGIAYLMYQAEESFIHDNQRISNLVENVSPSSPESHENWRKLQDLMSSFAVSVGKYIFLYTVNSKISEVASMSLYNRMQKHTDTRLFSDQALVKISGDRRTQNLFHGLDQDYDSYSYYSINMLIGATSTLSTGAMGVYKMLYLSWSFSLPFAAYALFDFALSSWLSNKVMKPQEDLQIKQNSLKTHITHSLQNARSIVETKGEAFVYNDLSKERIEIQNQQYQIFKWKAAFHLWKFLSGNISYTLVNYITAYNIHYNSLLASDRAAVRTSANHFNNFLVWSANNYDDLLKVKACRERIERADRALLENSNRERNLFSNFGSKTGSHNIKGITISILQKDGSEKGILSIEELDLESGKRYALSGPTGQGKSSFLAKIMGIDSDNIKASGTIELDCDSKDQVIMIPQHDFFPLDKSLLETICYPSYVNESDTNKIIKLLEEAGLNDLKDRLDEVSDFTETISGGQKKAIKIIGAIIRNPKLLLLDETLTGLDDKTCSTIQTLIAKYLPNTTTLVVDHTIDINNREINGKEFYDGVLLFNDNTVIKTTTVALSETNAQVRSNETVGRQKSSRRHLRRRNVNTQAGL